MRCANKFRIFLAKRENSGAKHLERDLSISAAISYCKYLKIEYIIDPDMLRSDIFTRLQQTARHAEAFSEAIISLPMFSYEELLETMGLSFQVMESTNSMGQVFWAGIGNGVDGRAFRM